MAADNFKLFLLDYHCRHVILGCSDNDIYNPLLNDYRYDQAVQSRMVLLEGMPGMNSAKKFSQFSFQKLFVPALLRENDLAISRSDTPASNSTRRSTQVNAVNGICTPRTETPLSTKLHDTPVLHTAQPAEHMPTHERTNSSASSTMISATDTTWNTVVRDTWAKRATAAADLPAPVQPPKPAPDTSGALRRNRRGQRIDPALVYEINELTRLKKLKLCNQYYLGLNGCCHRSDKCPHRHDYKATVDELKTVRCIARETPCKRGTECIEDGCIYGHRCPFPQATEGTMRGIGCLMGETCKFPREMHGIVDLAPVRFVRATGAF
jgi:hypothetical protein